MSESKKSDHLSQAAMDAYIQGGHWPGARSHEGCKFVESVITGTSLDNALIKMMAEFEKKKKKL